MALPGRVGLVPSSQMEVCPTAISSASVVNILEAPMFHLLYTTEEFSKRNEGHSQNLLQGLVSHELVVYLSIFNQFKLS